MRRLKAPAIYLVALACTMTALLWMRYGSDGHRPRTATSPAGSKNGEAAKAHSASGETTGSAAPHAELLDTSRLLSVATDHLRRGTSVSARVFQRVHLQGRELAGVGAYWHEPAEKGGRFRLEIRTRVAGKSAALQFVSNGNYIWRDIAIAENRKVSRVDLRQFAQMTGLHEGDSAPHTPSSVWGAAPAGVGPLELGGLPQLLTSLQQLYRFDNARRGVLLGVPVYELEGNLSVPQLRAVLLEKDRSAKVPDNDSHYDLADVPRQVPSHVAVYLGQDDLFPYRFVFRFKNAASMDHENGVPFQVDIQFQDVSFAEVVDSRRFEYSPPPDTAWEDITSELALKVAPAS